MIKNSIILRNIILPIGDFAFGQNMIQRLKFLEKAQWWSRELILTYQNQGLKNLVNIAYNEVPFYRDLYDLAKISPGEINTSKDLLRLPIVTKNMLRQAYPTQVTRPTGQKTYQASTSGSTGQNFFVMEDAYTAGWYRATFLLELEWAGWMIGEPHLQTGMTLKRSLDRRLKDWLLGCHYVSAYDLSDAHLEEILQIMEKKKLKHLWGYPGSLYYLARHAQKRGWNQPLKSAVTWGDTLFLHYRESIENTFQTKVYDTYGCAEGIQIAAQCEFGNYHLHALDTLVEFLDDEGLPVKAGEIGNIVVTRLHPGPMPLIRYAIGDLGVPSTEKNCPCGRGLPLMHAIKGRNADVVTTPSGNRLIVHFFTGVMEHFTEIDSFQVVQSSPASILVRIVPDGEKSPGLETRVINALKQKGADDLNIQVVYVDQIPLPPTGKHRFVINECK